MLIIQPPATARALISTTRSSGCSGWAAQAGAGPPAGELGHLEPLQGRPEELALHGSLPFGGVLDGHVPADAGRELAPDADGLVAVNPRPLRGRPGAEPADLVECDVLSQKHDR